MAALAGIRPEAAVAMLEEPTRSTDKEIAEAAHGAMALASGSMDGGDEDDGASS